MGHHLVCIFHTVTMIVYTVYIYIHIHFRSYVTYCILYMILYTVCYIFVLYDLSCTSTIQLHAIETCVRWGRCERNSELLSRVLLHTWFIEENYDPYYPNFWNPVSQPNSFSPNSLSTLRGSGRC